MSYEQVIAQAISHKQLSINALYLDDIRIGTIAIQYYAKAARAIHAVCAAGGTCLSRTAIIAVINLASGDAWLTSLSPPFLSATPPPPFSQLNI